MALNGNMTLENPAAVYPNVVGIGRQHHVDLCLYALITEYMCVHRFCSTKRNDLFIGPERDSPSRANAGAHWLQPFAGHVSTSPGFFASSVTAPVSRSMRCMSKKRRSRRFKATSTTPGCSPLTSTFC